MHAESWKLRLPAAEAAFIYAAIVSGRSAARPLSAGFDQEVANFLADYEMTHAKGTFATVTMYFRAHIIPFFGSFDAFTLLSYADYVRMRIGRATRVTVRKELSTLRQFVDWCGQCASRPS